MTAEEIRRDMFYKIQKKCLMVNNTKQEFLWCVITENEVKSKIMTSNGNQDMLRQTQVQNKFLRIKFIQILIAIGIYLLQNGAITIDRTV